MKLGYRLNSFPVIVVAALLLAALVGFALGFGTSQGAAPTLPQTALDNGAPSSGRADSRPGFDDDRPRANRRVGRPPQPGNTQPRDNKSDHATSSHQPKDDKTPVKPGPRIKAGAQRKLPQGRVDKIEQAVAVEKPNGAIEVTVSNSRGMILPFALLALDVNSGPLGWQVVPKQPQAVPEQRGVFQFKGLYPGEYRVRSLATNYKAVSVEVRLQGADSVESVSIMLEQLEYSQVEFYIHYDDGTSPSEVELTIVRQGEDTTGNGRFKTYENEPGLMSTTRRMPPTRMRQRTGTGGLIRLTLPQNRSATVNFAARRDDTRYEGGATLTPVSNLVKQDVTLKPAEDKPDAMLPGGKTLGTLRVVLTLDGKAATFSNVNLRQDVNDFQYRPPSTTENNRYVWQNVYQGKWYLVAESPSFHAPFVSPVEVGSDSVQTLDIKTGHLRVTATRASGTPDPGSGEARYRVRLRPMGSGTIERAYVGNLTGKQSDFIDFIVPVGQYDVRVESPEHQPKLSVTPVEQSINMSAGGDLSLAFTVDAGSTLSFQCVDSNGAPVPNAEFLVTFNAAGQVPESEKANTLKGDFNGNCKTALTPSGPVYVMIWTSSQDWNNPDKVFQVDLPAYGNKDLGAVVVGQ